MTDLTWTTERKRLGDIVEWPKNPRQLSKHDAEQLRQSIDRFGLADPLIVNVDGSMIGGHQRKRVMLALQEFGPDALIDVRVPSRQLTEREAEELAIRLNRNLGEWDWDGLANEFELDDLLEWGFTELELGIDALSTSTDNDDNSLSLLPEDVPDALFPSDNEWGVPTLDAALQPIGVELPVALWGALGRKSEMQGTWLFYCDDYRFEAVWKDPSGVVNTGCVSVVEPNFTVGPQTPRAVALWQVYRKRWLARWWQSFGIRVFVDLNMDVETFEDIMLLGVPEGWKAYATRGYIDRIDCTLREYELAERHSGGNPLFLLYGGGHACKELAQEKGWVWISEHMDVKHEGVVQDG